ncbi:MAG: ABC transporter substrate-binding protein [Deferribacteres bacterium]|nr:ABC transporter substrate-binding protein [Deferribacteres bacterium]
MKKTAGIIIGVVAALMLVSAAYVHSMSKKPVVKDTFRIGMIAPLTGDAGFVGVGMKNALLMAREQWGDGKYNYEFVFEDDQLDPKLSASAAQKLLNVDKVDAIVTVGHAPRITVPLARQYDIIHFAIAVQKDIPDGVNNFSHWAPSVKLNGLLIKEMQKRGIKKVGVFRTTSLEAWVAYYNDFLEGIKNTDIRVVTDQTFKKGEKDFRSLIARAKPTNPDIYLIFVETPELEIVAKQIREAGINTPFTTLEGFEVTEQPELFEGYWYVSPVEPSEEFSKAYEAKFGKRPPVCSPNAYDIFNLLATAVERAGSSPSKKPATAQIARELKKIKSFPGALGDLLVSDNGMVMSGVQVKMIKNGKPIALEH